MEACRDEVAGWLRAGLRTAALLAADERAEVSLSVPLVPDEIDISGVLFLARQAGDCWGLEVWGEVGPTHLTVHARPRATREG